MPYEIKNFDKYQHYEADRPAWLKWYRDITTDLAWIMLPDDGKLMYPYLLLVAAENKQQVPEDLDALSKRLGISKTKVRKGLSALVEAELLLPVNGAGECRDVSPRPAKSSNREEKRREEKRRYVEQARRLVDFLNEKADRNFHHVDTHLDRIAARLKEGAEPGDVRAMIVRRCRKWKGTDMEEYLRPGTLFNKEKFWQYMGEVGSG